MEALVLADHGDMKILQKQIEICQLTCFDCFVLFWTPFQIFLLPEQSPAFANYFFACPSNPGFVAVPTGPFKNEFYDVSRL